VPELRKYYHGTADLVNGFLADCCQQNLSKKGLGEFLLAEE